VARRINVEIDDDIWIILRQMSESEIYQVINDALRAEESRKRRGKSTRRIRASHVQFIELIIEKIAQLALARAAVVLQPGIEPGEIRLLVVETRVA